MNSPKGEQPIKITPEAIAFQYHPEALAAYKAIFGESVGAGYAMFQKGYLARHAPSVPAVEGVREADMALERALLVTQMAETFLRWPLPDSVCADLCATKQGPGRVGTNLLSFVEANAMFDAIVAPVLAALAPHLSPAHPTVKQAEGVMDTERLDLLENAMTRLVDLDSDPDTMPRYRLEYWEGVHGHKAVEAETIRGVCDAALRSASQPGGTEG